MEATVGAWSIIPEEEGEEGEVSIEEEEAAVAAAAAFCLEGDEEEEDGAEASSSEIERCDLDSELIVETDDAALEGIPPRLTPLMLLPPPPRPAAFDSTPALAVVLNAIFLFSPSDHSAVLTKALK